MIRRLGNLAALKRYTGALLVAVVGLVLMVVIIRTGPTVNPADQTPTLPVVQVVAAQLGPMRMVVTTHGVVAPKTESRLVSEVSGRILHVADSMVSGGFFRRGDLLVRIDSLDYDLALQQARARLASATSELESAVRAFVRQDELTASQSGSESQRDEALNRQKVAAANVREAEAQVARAERDLAQTQVLAPYDGRVRTEQVDAGQFVARGETLAHLYSVDFAEVRLPVHDDDLVHLPLALDGTTDPDAGLDVVLRARFAGRNHTWRGRIVRTEGEIDAATRLVGVIAEVPRPYLQPDGTPPLTPGLFVEAEIQGRNVEDVAVLPRSALQGENRVHVIGSDNLITLREVEVLRLLGEDVYLRGLRPNEKVSVTRLPTAIEGARVRVAENQTLNSAA